MAGLTVLAEALAVISDHHDDGVPPPLVGIEPLEQSADLRIDVGDLADVGPVAIARGEGLGRLVGRVRVVVVHPGEEAPRWVLIEPAERCVRHLAGRPLDLAE